MRRRVKKKMGLVLGIIFFTSIYISYLFQCTLFKIKNKI